MSHYPNAAGRSLPSVPRFFPPISFSASRRGVSWGVLSMGLLGVAGCSLTPRAPLVAAPTPLPAAQKRVEEAARYRSLSAALGKIDAQTVRAWVNRWSAPQGSSRAGAPREVSIDVEALARRHPAWILAEGLESGAVAPDAPQIGRVLAVAAPAFPRVVAGENRVRTSVLPARAVGENFDGLAARRRQDAALDRFFASAAARQSQRERDEAFLARRTLEDSIAAAGRGAVGEIDLSLLPPDVVLELTNLRLELLRNVAKTPAERAAASREIEAIEARYAAILSRQTALLEARLREATRDLPARQRREGLARLEREAQAEAQNRAAARREVSRESKNRLARDFGRENADLRLVLPPARAVKSASARENSPASQSFETAPALGASSGALKTRSASLATPARFETPTISRLRAKARLEARQWATLVAAQLGSRWNNEPGNPDRTAAALAILFPAPPR